MALPEPVEPEFHKFKSRDFAAQKWGISGKAFETYVKLNDLIPPLLNMVDSEQIPVKAGYQLAFLPEERQKRLLDILEAQRVGINEKTARELRDTEPEDWLSIIGVKEAKEPTWKFTIPRAAISSQRAKVYLKDPALQELIAQTVNRYLAAREEEEGV